MSTTARLFVLASITGVAGIVILALCLIAGTHNTQAWAFAAFGALAGGGSVHLYHDAKHRR